MLEKKNPIQEYLELLAAHGEESWKESLIGMGHGPDVPKVFRHAGKVRGPKGASGLRLSIEKCSLFFQTSSEFFQN